MALISLSVLTVLFGTCCSSSIVRIPFTIEPANESLRMYAWIPRDTPLNFVITANMCSEFVRGQLNFDDVINFLTSTGTESGMVRFSDPLAYVSQWSRNTLAVGVDSHFVEIFESVSLIKISSTDGELVLGTSRNSFLTHCYDRNTILIPLIRVEERAEKVFDSQWRFGNTTMDLSPTSFIDVADGSILDLEFGDYLSISQALQAMGAIDQSIQDGFLRFANCTRELIENHFHTFWIDVPTHGSIQLSFEDFIRFESGNYCQFKFSFHISSVGRRMNPFAIPGMNTRFTNTTAEFCDSL